jgi:hypothetical protein
MDSIRARGSLLSHGVLAAAAGALLGACATSPDAGRPLEAVLGGPPQYGFEFFAS